MSIEAVAWALRQAPIPKNDHLAHVVLIALADRVQDDWCAAWPSIDTLARDARCSRRSVQMKLQDLLDAGLIRKGDQRHVAHLPANRRPTVYDIIRPGVQTVHPNANMGENHATDHVSAGGEPDSGTVDNSRPGVQTPAPQKVLGCRTVQSRGAESGSSGVQAFAHKPSLEPSIEPRETTYVTTRSDASPVDNSPTIDPDNADVCAATPSPTRHTNDPCDAIPVLSDRCPTHAHSIIVPPCHACRQAREAFEAQQRLLAEQRARAARAREREEFRAEQARIARLRADPVEQAAIAAKKQELRERFRAKKVRIVA